MNYVESGEPPREPHLALGPDADGMSVALPVGACIQLVLDPNAPSGVQPVFLKQLWAQGARVKLVLNCNCGKAGCTRSLVLKGIWSGRHPVGDDGAMERLAKGLVPAP